MYIVLANQVVISALAPSIPTSTAAFRRKSFKLCISPSRCLDNAGRAHTPGERQYRVGCRHMPRATQLPLEGKTDLVVLRVEQLEIRGDSLPHRGRSLYQWSD